MQSKGPYSRVCFLLSVTKKTFTIAVSRHIKTKLTLDVIDVSNHFLFNGVSFVVKKFNNMCSFVGVEDKSVAPEDAGEGHSTSGCEVVPPSTV